MKIEELILQRLMENFDGTDYQNDWDDAYIAYVAGTKDALLLVKEAIFEYYNDNFTYEEAKL